VRGDGVLFVMPGPSPGRGPAGAVGKIWQRLKRLSGNGILIQAVGIPFRHSLALYGIYLLVSGHVGAKTVLFSVFLWIVSGLGVTAGAHRLWTHQSYKVTPCMEALLIVMFSIADQGAIEGWALTHAMHHSASDTPADPHDRTQGWWHAHFGWLYSAQQFRLTSADYHRVTEGLSPLVRLHDSISLAWDPLWSHGMPALVASCWGEAANGFFVAGALRWMFVQHVTFFVNSVAHGPREAGDPHSFDASADGIGPRVSLLTTVLALGEGWHDYHHLFPWDYAAAELDSWDQWNPTKMFIDACAVVGLTSNRRRCSMSLQLARRAQLAGLDRSREKPEAWTKVGPPFLRHRVKTAATTVTC